MKNQSFRSCLGFAVQGVRTAWLRESSFCLQCVAALCVLLALLWFRPVMLCWALLLLLNCCMVPAAELFNNALEHALDHLTPERHAAIQVAKDCSAGAVLLLSLAASGRFIAFLIGRWGLG